MTARDFCHELINNTHAKIVNVVIILLLLAVAASGYGAGPMLWTVFNMVLLLVGGGLANYAIILVNDESVWFLLGVAVICVAMAVISCAVQFGVAILLI